MSVLTPPLDDHILASITRALVIELADATEQACTLEDCPPPTRRSGLDDAGGSTDRARSMSHMEQPAR